ENERPLAAFAQLEVHANQRAGWTDVQQFADGVGELDARAGNDDTGRSVARRHRWLGERAILLHAGVGRARLIRMSVALGSVRRKQAPRDDGRSSSAPL